MHTNLQNFFENTKNLDPILYKSDFIDGERRDSIHTLIEGLDSGRIKVVESNNGVWEVNIWVKSAITLAFVAQTSKLMSSKIDSQDISFDKFSSKFANWKEQNFKEKNLRVVPNCFVRQGSFIGQNCILMPCFINIGAWIGDGTMIDTFSTIGSCAHIGANVHISGGVGIGGVLEPVNARPTIIEDNVFIGARSEIAEGVVIEEGAVIAMGCFIGASTKIFDRSTGEISFGVVPKYSVVVPGSMKTTGDLSLNCVVIVKKVDSKTRSKTKLNELLRDI